MTIVNSFCFLEKDILNVLIKKKLTILKNLVKKLKKSLNNLV